MVKLNKMYAEEILPQDSCIDLSGGTVVKNLPANAEATGDTVSAPGSGRRKWQPTPVFLPGESYGQRSLAGCILQGCKESDMTEVTASMHS